jgi:hypothetical protein
MSVSYYLAVRTLDEDPLTADPHLPTAIDEKVAVVAAGAIARSSNPVAVDAILANLSDAEVSDLLKRLGRVATRVFESQRAKYAAERHRAAVQISEKAGLN